MKIKNWNKFQHFKDRQPPWIKLYRDILDQLDINMISDCSFRVLIGLWLLASEDEEMEGNLPTVDEIAFRLRKEKQIIINSLEELSPFIEDFDINMISARYQLDEPETETETETEKHLSKDQFQLENPQIMINGKVPYTEIINLYHTILPELPSVVKLTDARKTRIKRIWNDGDITSLESWEKYFNIVKNSSFLMGRGKPDKDTGRVFTADFDFIINPNKLVRIIEGKYRDQN